MMKKAIWFGLLLFTIMPLQAQHSEKAIPVSISYLGRFAYQPGIKVGTEFSLMGRSGSEHYRQWYASPQIAFFTNPGNNTNYMLNFEAGIRKSRKSKNSYSAFSAGLGFLLQSRQESFTVNLGSGDQGNRQRDSQSFVLPTLSYERGWRTHKPVSWFTKYSIGSTLLAGNENQLMMFVEFGVKFKIKKEVKNQQR